MKRRKFLAGLAGAAIATVAAPLQAFHEDADFFPEDNNWIAPKKVDMLTREDIDRIHKKIKAGAKKLRPITVDGEEYYLMVVSPESFRVRVKR